MVYELLPHGKSKAITGRELAEMLNCDIRKITEQIAQERREGHPICANAKGSNAGYYLAATPEELEEYCGKLYHRGGELFKTRRALIKVLKTLQEQKVQEVQK